MSRLWTCDACNTLFDGEACRFKCLSCSDFDLCDDCWDNPRGWDKFGDSIYSHKQRHRFNESGRISAVNLRSSINIDSPFAFAHGTRVYLHSLRTRTELNGAEGTVQAAESGDGGITYQVELSLDRRIISTQSRFVSAAASVKESARSNYLYYWDDRDGRQWQGWWLTPDRVGNDRYLVFSPGDVPTPLLCSEWRAGWGAGSEGVIGMGVTKIEDGTLSVRAGGRDFEGLYKHDRTHQHTHGGRPVYRRVSNLTKDSTRGAIHLSSEEELKELLDEHSAVLLAFFTDTCRPCQQMRPVFCELAQQTSATFAMINLSKGDLSRVASAYGVCRVPTILHFAHGRLERALEVVGNNPTLLKTNIEELVRKAGSKADEVGATCELPTTFERTSSMKEAFLAATGIKARAAKAAKRAAAEDAARRREQVLIEQRQAEIDAANRVRLGAGDRPEIIPNGTAVTIRGLLGAVQHNAKRGRVVEHVAASGRYSVQLDDGESLPAWSDASGCARLLCLLGALLVALCD
jgi:thioredoxin 1